MITLYTEGVLHNTCNNGSFLAAETANKISN